MTLYEAYERGCESAIEKLGSTALMRRITRTLYDAKKIGRRPKDWARDPAYQNTKKIFSNPDSLQSRRGMVSGILRDSSDEALRSQKATWEKVIKAREAQAAKRALLK